MRRGLALVVAVVTTLVWAVPAEAAPGDLDQSFGSGGQVTTAIGHDAGASAVAVQGNRTLVAGWGCLPAQLPNVENCTLAVAFVRYLPNGRPDPAFGQNGTVLTTVEGKAASLAVQPDGKLVTAISGVRDIEVARFLPDGSRDLTFGAAGVSDAFLFSGGAAEAVALQPDGKIVVAGRTATCSGGARPDGSCPDQFALARFRSDGRLDPAFGTHGLVTVDFTTDSPYLIGAWTVTVQPDGKIVAGGSGPGGAALARLNPDGSLDTGFGVGGKIGADGQPGIAPVSVNGLLLAPTGRIIAVGSARSGFFLIGLTPQGALDPGFGNGGMTATCIPDSECNDHTGGAAWQADGKIVVVGDAEWASQPSSSFALARYDSNGVLDTSFGTNGTLRTAFSPPPKFGDHATAVAVTSTGRIVAAGWTTPLAPGDSTTAGPVGLIAVARYLSS